MAKQQIKYKVIRQSSEMGSRFYGVIDNADPINATLAMQQIIDYKKLHNFSAKQLTVLVEDVLQGAAELVARDGMSRNLSSLLKFEARIRGTFANTESGISDQTVLVKPRMLRDIKVNINKSDFTFVNVGGDSSPKILGLAQESDSFQGWGVQTAFYHDDTSGFALPFGPLTVSGVRLAPDGWTEECKISIAAVRGDKIFRLDLRKGLGSESIENTGFWNPAAPVASDNVLKFDRFATPDANAWDASTYDPTVDPREAAILHAGPEGAQTAAVEYLPTPGDRIIVSFARPLGDGSGSVVMSSKEVVLGE